MARKQKEEAPATGPPAATSGTALAEPPTTTGPTDVSTTVENPRPSDPVAPRGNEQKTQPVFTVGPIPTDKDNAVAAAVWENDVTLQDGRTFKVHTVTVEARYCDAKGEWKSAKGFRGSQLYAVIYCLHRASDLILVSRDPSNDCPFCEVDPIV